jgi:hypothetical protein
VQGSASEASGEAGVTVSLGESVVSIPRPAISRRAARARIVASARCLRAAGCSAQPPWVGRSAACWAGRAKQQDGLTMALTYGYRADPYNKAFFLISTLLGVPVCPIMTIVG